MRRWYWSAAILACLAASAAQAQYVVIRVYVGGKDGPSDSSGSGAGQQGPGGLGPQGPGGFGPQGPGGFGPQGPGGFGPQGPGGFGPQGPGGFGPQGPGGFGPQGPGGPGGIGGPGGLGGPGGMGPGGPGGIGGPGGLGGPGGMGPGGPGGIGGPGGLGGPGGMGPGGPGGIGGPGGLGGPGGMGPGGLGGMGGMGPGGMGGGGGLGSNVQLDTQESYVLVAIEVESIKSPERNEQLGVRQFKHAWGKTALFTDGTSIIANTVEYKSPARKFAEDRKKLVDKKEKKAEEYITLARYAIAHGLINECDSILDELMKAKLPANADSTTEILNAYAKVKADLARTVIGGSAIDEWKRRLPDYSSAPSQEGHYVLFYADNSKDTPAEVTRRLELLEQNMRAYFLWFALQGKALPVPEERLIGVMVPDASSFKQQRLALDAPSGVTDGFFAARDNVAVFSTTRLDEAYQVFSKMMQAQVWQRGWSRGQLLAGKEVPRDLRKEKTWRDDYRRYQTLALVDKALEREAELASVTHEGTKQLAIATGLYPKSVAAPQWIQFGFASLFDTPKGPYAGANGTAKTAFWPVYGGPNWAYFRPFRIWAASKDELKKLDDPPIALRQTVTDYYFQNIRKDVQEELEGDLTESERKRKEQEIVRAKEDRLRAHAQAWALTYYLARYRMDGLMAYFDELSQLPRDLELDEETMLLTFGRAFKLLNAEGTAIDEAKLKTMAEDWFERLKQVEVPPVDFALKPREDPSAPSGNPGGPGGFGPGGLGGPGGGPGGLGGPGRPGG